MKKGCCFPLRWDQERRGQQEQLGIYLIGGNGSGPEQFPVPGRMWPWWPAQGERPSQIHTPFRAGSGRCLTFYPLHGPRGRIYADRDHRSSPGPSKSLSGNPALGGVTGSWAISMASHWAAKANAKGRVEAGPPGGRRSHGDLAGASSEGRGGLLGFHEDRRARESRVGSAGVRQGPSASS